MKEKNIEDRFRISTNGIKYRVEFLRDIGMLWWKKQVWNPIGFLEYDDDKGARMFMNECIKIYKSKLNGWKPIE